MPIGDMFLKFGMEIGHKYSFTYDMMGSLPCSQEPSTRPCPEPDKFSSYHLTPHVSVFERECDISNPKYGG
jgi:hypothetical protein